MTISVDADPTTQLIRVSAPARLADIVSSIPGLRAMRGAGNVWEGPVTAATVIAIAYDLSSLKGFEPTAGAQSLMNFTLALQAEVDQVKTAGVTGYDDRLWDYQPAGVWMLVNRKRALLGDDMGTGKTVMALTAARHVSPRTTLVVAPNSMKHRWGREVETWFPEAAPFVLDGTAKNKAEVMFAAADAAAEDTPVVVSVNWESLTSLSRISGYGSIKLTEKDNTKGPLNDVLWECVIADEAHRAKDPKAKQTRALWFLAKEAEYRWGLTGTPVLNTPSDLWAIGRFYDPATYGTSSHRWHQRYVAFDDTYWGPEDTGLRHEREKEFAAWFDLGFIRRTKAEVLDLPPVSFQTRELEMTPKQRAAYNRMVTDMMTVIDDQFLIANNPLTLLTRLSQIASATPVIEDMRVVALDNPSNKIKALMDFIEDELPEDEQMVIASPAEKLISLACSELERKGHEFIRITGKETSKVRDINIERFQASEVRFAMVTTGAGSEGIDLFAANTLMHLNRSYKYGENTQIESRVDRAGQTKPVTIIDLVSKGTVDEAVLSALQSKEEMAEQVLRDQARQLLRSKV